MFPNMTEVVPEGQVGQAAVEHFEIDENAARWSALRDRRLAVTEGRYARLTIQDKVWMSDTRMERTSNQAVVLHAHGRVLIAGLGLGMLLQPILANPAVTEVVVIERDPDVIALVAPHFPDPKLKVIQGDIFQWRPAKGATFNTLYFDIWPDICETALDDITKLHRTFARFKDKTDPEAWMESWMMGHLRAARSERRNKRRHGWR
jgi:hypothetical protein